VDVLVAAAVVVHRRAVADHGLGNDLVGAARRKIVGAAAVEIAAVLAAEVENEVAVAALLQTTKKFLAKISSSKF